MPRHAYPEPKKGARIKLTGGSNHGCKAWLDNARSPTDCYTPIIVEKGKGDKKKEVQTKVLHENYEMYAAVPQPRNYEEAMLDQHPDIDKLMTKLARKIAQCERSQGEGDGGNVLGLIFLARVKKVKVRQEKKGRKALWRRVVWNPPAAVMQA